MVWYAKCAFQSKMHLFSLNSNIPTHGSTTYDKIMQSMYIMYLQIYCDYKHFAQIFMYENPIKS